MSLDAQGIAAEYRDLGGSTRQGTVVQGICWASDESGPGAESVMVDVLAPLLTSHAHAAVSDIDRERAEARVRLERSLAWAREHGIRARGEIGDPSTSTAMADELRRFGADEVIVVTHPRERQSWQERGELKRLRSELDVPVVQVVIDERVGS